MRHVDAAIWIGIEDVERAVVITNRRGPDAAAVLRLIEHIIRWLALEDVADDRPVDQVFRAQNRQTRRGVETRSDQVIIIADANGVRIGIIGVDDRVFIRAVAVVGDPNFRACARARVGRLRSLRCQAQRETDEGEQHDAAARHATTEFHKTASLASEYVASARKLSRPARRIKIRPPQLRARRQALRPWVCPARLTSSLIYPPCAALSSRATALR